MDTIHCRLDCEDFYSAGDATGKCRSSAGGWHCYHSIAVHPKPPRLRCGSVGAQSPALLLEQVPGIKRVERVPVTMESELCPLAAYGRRGGRGGREMVFGRGGI